MNRTHILIYLTATVLFADGLISSGWADEKTPPEREATKNLPATADEVLFTFAIFGDNKIGGPRLDRVFRDIQKIKPSFVIGMGDHYQSAGSMDAFDASVRKSFGYARFWPTPGDNEDQYWAGRQAAFGAQKTYFVRLGLFDKAGKARRAEIVDSNPEMFDYYARFLVNGVRIHLVSLYDQDSMIMQKSTRAFADRVLPMIKENYPGERLIFMAHDGAWWKNDFEPGHAVYSSELLLGASRHVYEFYNHMPQGAGTNLAFNTSALFRQGRSWYAVMVLSDKFVVLNISDEEFAVKGKPGCHIKPLGKPGRPGDPAVWLDKLKGYASGIKTKWGPKPQCETPQDLKDANRESGVGDRRAK